MLPLRRRFFLVVPALIALTVVDIRGVAAQPRGNPAEDKQPVRAYDVRDLIIDVPDFEYVPELGVKARPVADAAPKGAPKEPPGPNGRSRAELMAEVLSVLRLRVPPKEHEGQLLVRATPPEHEAVARTLAALRERLATQVSIESRLVRVDDAALDTIERVDVGLARKVRLASFRGGDRAGTLLSPEEANRLSMAMDPVTCPRITLFNGQRAYVLVANQRAFAAKLVAKKDAQGDEKVEPELEQVDTGVVLSAQATAAPGTHAVALNARVQHALLHRMREEPAPNFPAEKGLKVQVPDYEKHASDINAVLPHGAYVLFGMTETTRPNAPEGEGPKAGTFFAVVRASVVRHDPVN